MEGTWTTTDGRRLVSSQHHTLEFRSLHVAVLL